jgi:hypothetical protein
MLKILKSLFLALILLFLTVSVSFAHDFSLTYSSVSVEGEKINVAITTPYVNLEEIYPDKGVKIEDIELSFFNSFFEKGFIVENDGKKCTSKNINTQKVTDVKLVAYEYVFTCKNKLDTVKFTYNLFFDVSESHENITDFYVDNFNEQIIFSKKIPTHELHIGKIRQGLESYNLLWKVSNFLVLGVKHILLGYDHILFILSLLLAATRFKSILKIATSFTVAHSITLIIATLGIFVLPSKLTESLIALSISVVAFENLLGKRQIKNKILSYLIDPKNRWVIAFVFGLVHGFGFSSVLREFGLPQKGLIISLLSFNLGVEVGQIFIISLIFPVLYIIRKKDFSDGFIKYASILIGGVGLFWFVQRVFY